MNLYFLDQFLTKFIFKNNNIYIKKRIVVNICTKVKFERNIQLL